MQHRNEFVPVDPAPAVKAFQSLPLHSPRDLVTQVFDVLLVHDAFESGQHLVALVRPIDAVRDADQSHTPVDQSTARLL